VYSFGCTLYEMLTRQWHTSDRRGRVQGEARERAVPIRASTSRNPPELVEIAQRCMAKSPQDRYRSFVEVSSALGEVLPGLTGKQRERTTATAG